MPTHREILAASLCDAMNGSGVWLQTASLIRSDWLRRADDLMREMARRGWMVVEIGDGERMDGG